MKLFKKDEKAEGGPAQAQADAPKDKVDELPDELPSLASEIADDSSKKDAVPDDLPSLDALKADSIPAEGAPSEEKPAPAPGSGVASPADSSALQKLASDDNSFFKDIFIGKLTAGSR